MAVSARAQTPTTASQIKAVFLYNFSQFVTWPTANNSNFVIGILGNDPFGSYIESVVEGEKVGNSKIVVQRYNDVKDVKNCQILYINQPNAAELAKQLSGHSILTVGEGEEFGKSGGIICFYMDNNKIRLKVNTRFAKAANLQISSKLLRVAEVIE
ncbi:MAG TPA: YfiR family protein [Flavisolibacter sp.]|nr:YfiR family protein [Flavisolibacter sp.]